MKETLLLTATIQPADVIFCDRNNVQQRLADYLHAFRFWLGEPLIDRIVLVENSGFDLQQFRALADKERSTGKQVDLLSFAQAPFDRNLGKSYGEALIIQHALAHSALLADASLVIKGTGRYVPTNFFRVWPQVRAATPAFVMANFHGEADSCDSRFFVCQRDFLRHYLMPLTSSINDAEGFYFEHALASAIAAARADGRAWAPIPGGGFLVDGVQGSTNTAFPYPLWKRLAYRAIARLRNGAPFRWRVGAPVREPGQGSRT